MQPGSGIPDKVLAEFIEYLQRRGRGSYTARSYRLGLGDFSRWLVAHDRGLADVTRQDIESYIDAFAQGDRVLVAARPSRPPTERAPRTINHRLSLLASFFAYLKEGDGEVGGPWAMRESPVPVGDRTLGLVHGMPGRDAPVRRARAELRRREPHHLPRDLDPGVGERLASAPRSWRDRAIITLLLRTGQRIGDWTDEHGRHGVLGMALKDLDRRTSTIVVRLKGARDEHRVPVTPDFWPIYASYLAHERGEPTTAAAWVALRRGHAQPLRYSAFEAALRLLSQKEGIKVTAHMFRHTLAQQLVTTAGLKVAQEVLGHRHISTTAETYAYADQASMVRAMTAVSQRTAMDATLHDQPRLLRYAFPYDELTIEELEAVSTPQRPGADQ